MASGPGPLHGIGTTAVFALVLATALAGCLDFLSQGAAAGPGEWAEDFLSDETYTSLTIEVDWTSGQRPASRAMDLLEQRANERLTKPGGITLVEDDSISTSMSRWSVEEILELEEEHRDHRKEGSETAMYVVYLDGRSDRDEGDSRILGVAYSASSFAIFKESIREVASNILSVSAEDIERSVVVHELGHLLGLVNNGIRMCTDHEDDDHPKHSDNKQSVMFWAIESDAIRNFLDSLSRTNPPTQFDSDDICDMRQAGGK